MFYYYALGLTLGRKQLWPQKTALILLNYQGPGVHDVRAGQATVTVRQKSADSILYMHNQYTDLNTNPKINC